jgi:hypothetical protein
MDFAVGYTEEELIEKKEISERIATYNQTWSYPNETIQAVIIRRKRKIIFDEKRR